MTTPPTERSGSLHHPDLAILWTATRKRLENNGITITRVPLKLKGLQDSEVIAVCTLLGRRRPKDNELSVDLRALDDLLASSRTGLGLIDTIEVNGGPLRDRKGERLAKNLTRLELWEAAGGHHIAHDPKVADWLGKLKRTGRLKRLGGNSDTLVDVLDAVHWLLANREVLRRAPLPLSTLASVQLGDAHALDGDTVVGALLGEAVCHVSSLGDPRAAWASFGIQLDQVSSSALAIGLPGDEGSMCATATSSGQPLRITWRMIEHGFGLNLRAVRDSTIYVCENPAVISMTADRHRERSAPLICTEGMPGSVTSALLDSVAGTGAQIKVHTDFDQGGLAIARYVIRRCNASAWRMGADDYLAVVSGPSSPLMGKVGPTDWDPALAPAMNHHRRAIHEEAIAHTLLDDLMAAEP